MEENSKYNRITKEEERRKQKEAHVAKANADILDHRDILARQICAKTCKFLVDFEEMHKRVSRGRGATWPVIKDLEYTEQTTNAGAWSTGLEGRVGLGSEKVGEKRRFRDARDTGWGEAAEDGPRGEEAPAPAESMSRAAPAAAGAYLTGPRFTYQSLSVATNNFKKRLGGGGRGSVFHPARQHRAAAGIEQGRHGALLSVRIDGGR